MIEQRRVPNSAVAVDVLTADVLEFATDALDLAADEVTRRLEPVEVGRR